MSEDFLKKFASKSILSDKSKGKRITHLYLNGKTIKEIGNLSKCTNLIALYLHNNLITNIKSLDNLTNLTHLYLQWNKIKKITNLNSLQNLRKLYIGYNEIERLENVEGLTSLVELHLEGQRISNEFTFDPSSLRAISQSLILLNISKLNLTKIDDLRCLICLEVLIAAENKFMDVEVIAYPLRFMPLLRSLDTHGCIAQQKDVYYRDKITANTIKLEYLDGKFITSNNRDFIKKFAQIKLERNVKKLQKEQSLSSGLKLTSKSESATNQNSKKSSFHLINNSIDELSFRPWNSLHSIQRPRRYTRKTQTSLKSKTNNYQLQGINIIK